MCLAIEGRSINGKVLSLRFSWKLSMGWSKAHARLRGRTSGWGGYVTVARATVDCQRLVSFKGRLTRLIIQYDMVAPHEILTQDDVHTIYK
jgi:hypothetical protein